MPIEKKVAKNSSLAEDTVKKQLAKLGGSNFVAEDIKIVWSQPYFLPVAVLNNLRRQAIEKLIQVRQDSYQRTESKIKPNNFPYLKKKLDYRGNVSNHLAQAFYKRHGVKEIEPAFELQNDYRGKEIMTTKHCLRYSCGLCPKDRNSISKRKKITEPVYLMNGKDKYLLEFDCVNCQMKIKKG